MPDRRVAVHLLLEVARYLKGGTEAAAVTRRVEAAVEELGDQADDTSRDMAELAATTDIAARQVDDLGDEARMTAAELTLLERQMHATARAAAAMAIASGGPDVDTDAGVRGSGMARTGAQAGTAFARGFGNATKMIPSSMHGKLVAAVVAAVVVAAPFIGAAIAGAVSGAVGVGGIVGGIISAAKDPRVKAAARSAGDTISESFFGSGGAFVQPTIDSLHVLEKGFLDLNLEDMFAKAAPFVEDLAEGVVGFVEGLAGGMDDVLSRSGEFIPVLADGLRELGGGLGDMISRMAESEGSVEGLRTLFFATADFARLLGTVVAWLGNRFHDMALAGGRVTGMLEDMFGWIPMVGDQLRDANDQAELITGSGENLDRVLRKLPEGAGHAGGAIATMADDADAAKQAIDEMNEALQRSQDMMLNADNARLRYQEGLLDLTESVKEHGTSLDSSTQKGIDNRQMINGLIGDLRAERDAAIDAADGNEEKVRRAKAAYEKQLTGLQTVLTKLGFEKAEIKRILDLYRDLANASNITKTITIREVVQGELFPRGSKPPGRQHGGPAHAGVLYETHGLGQREFFRPAMNGAVVPMAAMAGVGGGAGVTVNLAVGGRPSGHLEALFVQWVTDSVDREVQRRGGRLG